MNAPLKAGLPPLPPRIAKLKRDARGFPVPWFVETVDGEPDFRVTSPAKMVKAYKQKLCWVCGEPLGRHLAFVIGPMCAVTRTTSEPACHRECAEFSAIACPFLSKPRMRRNDKDIPEEAVSAAGIHLDRNPGVACVWISASYRPFNAGNGTLFKVGDPEEVLWFCEGRAATKPEVVRSIETGMPHLTKLAVQDGPKAVEELRAYLARLTPWLPREVPQVLQ